MSFYKTFNKLCKVHDNTVVFRDWLDYGIDQFLINPDLKYFQYDKYNENEYKLFFELFETWIKNMETRIKEGYKWFDLIGYFYEETRHNNLNTGTINLSETKEKFLENILREISPQLTDKQYNTLRIVLVNELKKKGIISAEGVIDSYLFCKHCEELFGKSYLKTHNIVLDDNKKEVKLYK